jgi:hypothetical protein
MNEHIRREDQLGPLDHDKDDVKQQCYRKRGKKNIPSQMRAGANRNKPEKSCTEDEERSRDNKW